MSLINSLKRGALAISIGAMILIIVGSIIEGGCLLQKLFFLIGASALIIPVYLNKQKMFMVLQIVVTIGAILAFCGWLSLLLRYFIMASASLIGIFHLIRINFFKEDPWWPLGGIGLLALAAGLATDAINFPILFNSLLASGGILLATYSAIELFCFKVKLAIIFLVLNLIFSINPLIIILTRLIH
jgi:hypothetical protein